MLAKPHVVSMVLNGVEGDSRVIKTAQAAMNAGYSATVVGVSSGKSTEWREVEGVRVMLLPSYAPHLKSRRMWGEDRDLRLLVGGYLRTAIPKIVALQPSLLHSHDMIGLKIGASAAQALRTLGVNVPWVHDLHELVAGLQGGLAEAYMPYCLNWEREFLHKADHLFTVSDVLAAELKSRYFLPELPTVTFNTPNLSTFNSSYPDVRSAIGLAQDIPLVVFVGGATPLRGCDTILEAVSQLTDVHLVMVSQGKYVDELAAKASAMGMGERFHTHPYVQTHRVTSFIRSADVGIHGLVHYPNAEVAMPNKLFEYLHADLPIVVSDVESMKSFVEKYGVGISFEAGNPNSCAEAIRFALNNKSKLRAKIDAPLKQKYSWEVQEEKIRDVYKRLLSQPRATLSSEQREHAILSEKIESIAFDAAYSRALAEATFRVGSERTLRKDASLPTAQIDTSHPTTQIDTSHPTTQIDTSLPRTSLRANACKPLPKVSKRAKAQFIASIGSEQGFWEMLKFIVSRVRRRMFSRFN